MKRATEAKRGEHSQLPGTVAELRARLAQMQVKHLKRPSC